MTNIGMATQAAEMMVHSRDRPRKDAVLLFTACISCVWGMFFLAAIERDTIARVNHAK
jgi:hypothetical protein